MIKVYKFNMSKICLAESGPSVNNNENIKGDNGNIEGDNEENDSDFIPPFDVSYNLSQWLAIHSRNVHIIEIKQNMLE